MCLDNHQPFASQFCAWRTDGFSRIPQYAVKIVDDTNEADIYDQLHRLEPTSPNHTLPCDVIRDEHKVLIMPYLHCDVTVAPERRIPHLSALLEFFRQVVEVRHSCLSTVSTLLLKNNMQGVEFLHSHNIAHMVR